MDEKKLSSSINVPGLSEQELFALNQILNNLYRYRGADFRKYSPKCLRRRVSVGMHDAKCKSFIEYLEFLRDNPGGYDVLLGKITINVSEFFRNPTTFKVVRDKVIPEIIKQKQQKNTRYIRVWSAGCATGEEPYSLAIIFKEIVEKISTPFKVAIYASDIDKEVLTKAEEGVYRKHALKELNSYQLSRYFEKIDEEAYRIKPELKSHVKFLNHNMISDPPLSRIDLVFCRNVIIYFNKTLQETVYKNLSQALVPGGYLVGGKSESLLGIEKELFERVDIKERILKKKTD